MINVAIYYWNYGTQVLKKDLIALIRKTKSIACLMFCILTLQRTTGKNFHGMYYSCDVQTYFEDAQ